MADIAKSKDFKSYIGEIERLCEEYLVKKAPGLPEGAKEAIVKFGPWISLILIIMSAPLILAFLGLGTALMPLSFLGGLNAGLGYTISMIFSLIMLVIQVIALPGLFKRKKSAWYLMFYASLLGAVQNAVSFNLGGLVVGTLLSLYILFQIKSYYK
jgi:hypothetical protein